MNKLFSTLAILFAATVANATLEAIQIPSGSDYRILSPGKVVEVQVLSTTATGTASVKAIGTLVKMVDEVTTTYATNVTYSLVYSNGTEIVTNTVAIDYSPFPSGMRYISYTTNETVTATSVTNLVPSTVLTVTNAVGSTITCSGGYGHANPDNAYLASGSTLFAEGTATGRVTLIIER